jgi:hypothetical protein
MASNNDFKEIDKMFIMQFSELKQSFKSESEYSNIMMRLEDRLSEGDSQKRITEYLKQKRKPLN